MSFRKFTVLVAVVFSSGVLLTACDITFKRRSTDTASQGSPQQVNSRGNDDRSAAKTMEHHFFSEKDRQLISDYFNASGNQEIMQDNYELTKTTEQLRKQLSISARLPAEIQILPLPLSLESMLQPTRGNMIRIQVEDKIIMLDIKSRIIMDMFSLEMK